MLRTLFAVFIAAFCVSAQEKSDVVYHTAGAVGAVSFVGSIAPVQGAPYSATISNESVQTLADGNRIVQTSTGTTARDSQGRTRQDTALPAIGNLSAANAPHLVFIQDPVTQANYTLNLSEKTAQKMLAPPTPALPPGAGASAGTTAMKLEAVAPPLPPPDLMPGTMAMPPGQVFFQKHVLTGGPGEVSSEDLGTQTMEGLLVTGTRTTHTIPAGEIGNERPIVIVTEIWSSPDLKTIVYSKRSDPRMGEQTFRLTNIVRAEPDASLFTVPADFKIIDGPKPVLYRSKP
jgi:hypothetical protein